MWREDSQGSVPLLTVGYGARDVEEFVALLQRFAVDYLVDVRSKPYSKYKPGYSRGPLEKRLRTESVRYVFMGDLLGGLPQDQSCYTNGKVDYEKCRSKQFHQTGIGRLRSAWEQQLRVALMCACGKPERCHRSKLVGTSLRREGIPVVHLDDRGKAFEHEEVILRLSQSPDLFGFAEEAATSRKRYV